MQLVRLNIFRFLHSPRIFVLLLAYLALALFFFFNLLATYNTELQRALSTYNLYQQELPTLSLWVIEKYTSSLIFMLLFFIPLLSASSLISEREQGTLMLLRLNGHSSSKIVISNFFAYLFILLFLILLTFSFPFVLNYFAETDSAVMLSGLLATTLVATLCLSVTLCIASICRNTLSSILVSFATLLLLYMFHTPVEDLDNFYSSICKSLSILWQTKDLVHGVLSLSSIVYFLSFSAIALALSVYFLSQQDLD
jgi:ABC-2 type transport system permease protein